MVRGTIFDSVLAVRWNTWESKRKDIEERAIINFCEKVSLYDCLPQYFVVIKLHNTTKTHVRYFGKVPV